MTLCGYQMAGDFYLQRSSCEPSKPTTERQLLHHLTNMSYVKIVSQNLRLKWSLLEIRGIPGMQRILLKDTNS